VTSTSHPLDDEAPGFVLSLVRYWRSSVLIILGAATLAYAGSLLLPEEYTASAKVTLIDPQNTDVFAAGGRVPEDFERYTARQATLAGSSRVLADAAEALGMPADDLFGKVSVEATEVAGGLVVTAKGRTAAEATDAANAVTQSYRSAVRGETQRRADERVAAIDQSRVELQDDIDAAQDALDEDPANPALAGQLDGALEAQAALNDRANEIRVNSDNFGDGIDLIDPAREPTAPAEPQPLRNAGIGLLLGFLVAGGLAWVRADRFRTVDDKQSVVMATGAPVLGAVPAIPPDQELAALTDGTSVPGEAYQLVTASLRHVFKAGVLLVSSAARGDGKTISSAGLAAAAARAGTRVALVDGDARACGLSERLLGSSERRVVGLMDVAAGTAALSSTIRRVELPDDVVLDFVPAGTSAANAAGLYRTTRMADAMRELREAYDVVVVDSPAVLAVADGMSLAMHVDAVVLVVRRKSALEQLAAVRDRLNLVDAPLIGCIFTRAPLEGVYEYAATASTNGTAPRKRRSLRRPGAEAGADGAPEDRVRGRQRRGRRPRGRDRAALVAPAPHGAGDASPTG
jgi:capsular exopolysaccharide synthesis family protein